ncbi:hypothetical protein BV25DRAFT_1830754 [Artomyces pyxidatus]|uniref:Uncharacterized protein n=1 Tax=Artomyces pyxidatus TaxID=48021 RepID=A0ACB8SPK9_9AGAM|nr:hypothetical protein BV25DRAFT_1830754 [Artomyces pyxidatus]
MSALDPDHQILPAISTSVVVSAPVEDPIVRHAKFYIDDDATVVFCLGKTLYKVHRYFLIRESHFFRDMFSLPPTDEHAHIEGMDDVHAIVLTGVTNFEFESILDFFYYGMHSDYHTDLTVWIALLSISTRLIFEKVRSRAITEINALSASLDPFEQILLAIKYDVRDWLKVAYVRIVDRDALITEKEAHRIPFSVLVMLMRARDYKQTTRTARARRGMVSTADIVEEEMAVMQRAES